MSGWVRTHDLQSGNLLEALDGTHWHLARKPCRWHACRAQTRYWSADIIVERCPCGAIRADGGPWLERNTRR